eukprot:g14988.t1
MVVPKLLSAESVSPSGPRMPVTHLPECPTAEGLFLGTAHSFRRSRRGLAALVVGLFPEGGLRSLSSAKARPRLQLRVFTAISVRPALT